MNIAKYPRRWTRIIAVALFTAAIIVGLFAPWATTTSTASSGIAIYPAQITCGTAWIVPDWLPGEMDMILKLEKDASMYGVQDDARLNEWRHINRGCEQAIADAQVMPRLLIALGVAVFSLSFALPKPRKVAAHPVKVYA